MITTPLKDKNGNKLCVGDTLEVDVLRRSPHIDPAFPSTPNINHGYYKVQGKLKFDLKKARYFLDVSSDVIDQLEAPMGRETTRQKLDIENIDWTKVERIQRTIQAPKETNDGLDFIEI